MREMWANILNSRKPGHRRDRAEERRKGVNPDYDGGFAADLSAAPGGVQGNQHYNQ